jgi:hypothetical protein
MEAEPETCPQPGPPLSPAPAPPEESPARPQARDRRGCLAVIFLAAITVIAVLAAVAPSLMRSRIAGESAAVNHCRWIGAGQTIWKRNDYDGNGVLDYARDYSRLYSTANPKTGEPLALIVKALADARGTDGTPYLGYRFMDLTVDAVEGAYDPAVEYGICAFPAQYNRSGTYVYVMNISGVVYQKDMGKRGEQGLTIYPNVTIGGWEPAN